MSDDPHAPTSAGPEPEAVPVAEPTPTVPPSEADWRTPPGTAAPSGGAQAGDRPEVQVGMAFAGGLAAALLLKVLTR